MGNTIQYSSPVNGEMLQAFGPLSTFFSSIVEQALAPYKAELAVLRKQVDSIDSERNGQAVKVPPGYLSWEEAKTKRFVSIKHAAYILDISEKSVRRKIADGTIKASKGLRHVRIPVDEIAAYQKRTV